MALTKVNTSMVSSGGGSVASNTALGPSALNANTTGDYNTAIGYQAGLVGTTAKGNTLVGAGAGIGLTTGSRNTFIGSYWDTYSAGAGMLVTTGSNNTIVGLFDGLNGGPDIRTASGYICLADGNGNVRQYMDSSGSSWFNTSSSTKPYNATSGIYANIGDTSYPILATSSTLVAILNRNTSTGVILEFKYNGTAYGSVSTNGSSVTYNTTSDYRLKEDIVPMTGALGKVSQLKPYTYTWKSNGESSQGFIAHELAEVCPDVVTGEKDAVDEEGNPAYQAVDYSKLVATLTAAIQELNAKVTALETKLAAK